MKNFFKLKLNILLFWLIVFLLLLNILYLVLSLEKNSFERNLIQEKTISEIQKKGNYLESEILSDEEAEENSNLIQVLFETPESNYKIYVPQGITVYELMKEIEKNNNNFSFKGREFPGLGFFVEEINGRSQNSKQGFYWIYYINGKPATVGVSQYKIKPNDIITWKYEKEH